MKINTFHYLSFCSSDENYRDKRRKQYKEHIEHKQDNDYAYKIYNDPSSAPDFLKYEAEGFNLAYPNWRNNPMIVHQLKQDTIWARATGKINPGLFESHFVPIYGILFGIFLMFEPLIVKKYKIKIFPKKSDSFNNVVNMLISLLGVYMAIDDTCYIFTAKRLDKLIRDKFKKNNKEQISIGNNSTTQNHNIQKQ